MFGANGHYIDASAVGDTLAFFPTGGQPTGHFATRFEVRDFSGVWQESLCWTDAYAGEPYMYCTRRQE